MIDSSLLVLETTFTHDGDTEKNLYSPIKFCKLKLPSGAWVDGVIYVRVDTDEYYVRTEENFRARFTQF